MVSVIKGLDVRKSRFAVLSLDDDSEEETPWQQAPAKSKPLHKKPGHNQPQGQGEEGKGLSKNAKKRARKKRNKSTSSDHDGSEATGQVEAEEKEKDESCQDVSVWLKKNEQAREEEFQKELRAALLQSTVEAKKYEKVMKDMKEAEERAMASSSKTKKTVKLTLQELHSLPSPDMLDNTIPSPLPEQRPQATKEPLDLDDLSPVDVMEGSQFSPLLEDIEVEVQKELTREYRASSSSNEEMAPRIAHFKDELEKKDRIIAKLRKDNTALKKSLTEAKERNQSLCTIMNQGEFSKKVELLKQVNELSAVRNDLASEVETLSSSLEQERTKNKTLKAQVQQMMNSQAKQPKH